MFIPSILIQWFVESNVPIIHPHQEIQGKHDPSLVVQFFVFLPYRFKLSSEHYPSFHPYQVVQGDHIFIHMNLEYPSMPFEGQKI
jgi:hypothetical protein